MGRVLLKYHIQVIRYSGKYGLVTGIPGFRTGGIANINADIQYVV